MKAPDFVLASPPCKHRSNMQPVKLQGLPSDAVERIMREARTIAATKVALRGD